MNGYIHSFESFGTVDGPGVRFVVFFQGCPMRCLYCHNPDTWERDGGSSFSVAGILAKYDGVKEFATGGMTATGGEPMFQLEFLTELFTAAKKKKINTCLDTSGIVFDPADTAAVDALIAVTDTVMLDIKHINDDEHRKLTGHGNKNILAFAEYLDKADVSLQIRHVVVPGITLNDGYLYETGRFIGALENVKAVDILPYHDMAKPKYESLGIKYPLKNTPVPTAEEMRRARERILSGINDVRSAAH